MAALLECGDHATGCPYGVGFVRQREEFDCSRRAGRDGSDAGDQALAGDRAGRGGGIGEESNARDAGGCSVSRRPATLIVWGRLVTCGGLEIRPSLNSELFTGR